jgi:hypothetical protein
MALTHQPGTLSGLDLSQRHIRPVERGGGYCQLINQLTTFLVLTHQPGTIPGRDLSQHILPDERGKGIVSLSIS